MFLDVPQVLKVLAAKFFSFLSCMLSKKAKNKQKKSYGNDFSNLPRSFRKVSQSSLFSPTDFNKAACDFIEITLRHGGSSI